MSLSRILGLVSVSVIMLGGQEADAAEAKKIVAKTAVQSQTTIQSQPTGARNYGSVLVRTADLTPGTQFGFKTIQRGWGPYAGGFYSSGPAWGYYNYYRPYAAYYPYYGYGYAYRPYWYGYSDPAFRYAYTGPVMSYYGGPGYAVGESGFSGAYARGRGYGGCYHW
jgi:hypothetical protein